MPRLRRPAVCFVTPGAAGREGDKPPNDVMGLALRAAAAGVDIVQVRERHLSDGALLTLVRDLLGVVDRSRTALIVNDRADVALAAGADGVHLRADAVRASRVRAIVPAGFLIGRSVHSAAEASEAQADGAVDYLMFGTVFPSASKPAGHEGAGLSGLAAVCANVHLPVIAIGGMTVGRAPQAAAAGAAGIAAIGMFVDADHADRENMSALVRQVRRAFDSRSHVV